VSEVFDLGTTRLRVLAATPTTTVLEGEVDPGAGAPWHRHTLEDETIIVLEGTLVVHDGKRRELAAGEAHVLPRGTRHAFANGSGAVARVLFVCSPGGLEQFFRALTRAEPADEAAAASGLEFDQLSPL
jgi:quercetin dioxygenase-like cupin family protein